VHLEFFTVMKFKSWTYEFVTV